MSEVALARLWQLADGTCCMLLKDSPRRQLAAARHPRDQHAASNISGGPTVAMDAAKRWRSSYGHLVEPPDSPLPT